MTIILSFVGGELVTCRYYAMDVQPHQNHDRFRLQMRELMLCLGSVGLFTVSLARVEDDAADRLAKLGNLSDQLLDMAWEAMQ